MKKITSLLLLIILSISINGCTGYKPIFSSSTSQFEIVDYSIEGNKILGKKIYSKLLNLSNTKKEKQNVKNIYLLLNVSKVKKATSKNSAGKILEYKITLDTKVKITDFNTNDKIFEQTLRSSLNYKTQDQHFDTIKLEKKSMDNLIEKTYQEIFTKLLENI